MGTDLDPGICLRLVCSWEGHPVLSAELTSLITDVDQAIFAFTSPPGKPVITSGLLAEAGLMPASATLHAVKGAAALALEIGRRWLTRNDSAEPDR